MKPTYIPPYRNWTGDGDQSTSHVNMSDWSVREQGKTRLEFSRRIYYTPKYLLYNKSRWQSDKIKEYGNARVMSSNPVAYHISELDLVNIRPERKVQQHL